MLFPPHYWARYGTVLEVAKLVAKIRPDVVHAHYLSHFGIVAGLYGRIFRFRPIVLTAWGSDVWIDAKGSRKKLIGHALRIADCITCDGDDIREGIIRLGADPGKVKIIYFGTDTKKFKPMERDPVLGAKFSIDGSFVVISLRNLEPIYDVETLIRSIPLVLEKVQRVKFLIAGRGSQRETLERLAESLGVRGNVEFLGFISSEDLPRYLSLADVYVSTSLSDGGLAASTAEAMACGLPVIVTDFGDNRKWVTDGGNGFVIPTKSPELLARRIVDLLKNDEARKKFGAINRKIIQDRNDYHKEMQKMEGIYEELIARYRKR